MRALLAIAALTLAACAPPAHQQREALLAPECPPTPQEGFAALDCRVAHGADNYMVRFAAEPAAATGGEVTVEAGGQRLTETNVSVYLAPAIEDVDGDGAVDVLIARDSGNVNVDYAFWRNVHGRYVRMGELNGVEFKRTPEGFLAAPARAGAADWSVGFYSVSDAAIAPLASVDVHAEGDADGHVTKVACTLANAPGIAALHLTRAQAQAKFCAEPAARVFDQ
jgi:hypothetical protein